MKKIVYVLLIDLCVPIWISLFLLYEFLRNGVHFSLVKWVDLITLLIGRSTANIVYIIGNNL